MSVSSSIVIAGHTDIMGSVVDRFRMRGERSVLENRHAPILRRGGVDVICDHLGGDSRYGYLPASGLDTNPLQRAMRLFDHAHLEVEESPSFVIAETVNDIRAAAAQSRISVILCLEGGSPLDGELAHLRNFYRLGLRSLGLTHNWRNQLADGVLERTRGGLSHFGKAVVEECNRLGVVVDISHMAMEGVADTLEISTEPVIASHSNPRAVMDHPHNLPDELLTGIAATGGVIGIFVLNAYLTNNPAPTIDDIIRPLEYLIDLVGIDHIALGPDIMENWDQQMFKAVTEGASSFESVPVVPLEYTYPEGFESVGKLGNLIEGMRRFGLDQDDIDKVLGGNLLRVYEQVWR